MNVITKNVASSNITNDFSIYILLLNFPHIYHIYHRIYLHKITKHSTPAETIALNREGTSMIVSRVIIAFHNRIPSPRRGDDLRRVFDVHVIVYVVYC